MLGLFLTFSNTPLLRTLPIEESPWGTLITELVIAVLLLTFMFLFRKRFV